VGLAHRRRDRSEAATTAPERLSDDAFLTVIRDAPLVSLDLIVANPAGEILLGLRNNEPAKGCWFVPGGRIRKDESLADAFGRIVREELGDLDRAWLDVTVLGVFEHHYATNVFEVPGVTTHYVVIACHVEAPPGFTPLRSAPQHAAYVWASRACLEDGPEFAADVHPNTLVYFELAPLIAGLIR
jgi:colanic acid biosynthesis protein WcaH